MLKMSKIDTLFKTKTAENPYSWGLHICMQLIEGSTLREKNILKMELFER